MIATSHPSDFAFDRLMTGELADDQKGAMQAHIAGCPLCTERHGQLARGAEEFATLRAARPFVGERIRARATRRWPSLFWSPRARTFAGAGVAVTAVAAALLLISSRPDADTDYRTTKGAALVLDVFVKRKGGDIESLLAGSRLAPGDLLRFRVQAATDGFFGLISADSAGNVMSYLPDDTRTLLPLKAAVPRLIDGGIELDGVLGHERLVAFLCRERLGTGHLVAAVRTALAAGGGDPLRMQMTAVPGGCTSTTLWFEKLPRP
jgi:hypothetical protein